ncbi:MAG: hypothetical protein NTV71_00075 [Candidatus Omnitrophica bacterium]|nr:hypothetical protein [Candidatus Omnitrophota bacterium]
MAEQMSQKQHTTEYIAISALVLVALVIGIMKFKKGDTDDEVFSRKEFNKKWQEVEILEASVPKDENEIIYNVENERFPFKSPFDDMAKYKEEPVDENVTLPEMLFQGMVWKSSRPQAIINNKVYDIKDVINVGTEAGEGNIVVKDITKEGIRLIYKKKEFIVRPK